MDLTVILCFEFGRRRTTAGQSTFIASVLPLLSRFRARAWSTKPTVSKHNETVEKPCFSGNQLKVSEQKRMRVWRKSFIGILARRFFVALSESEFFQQSPIVMAQFLDRTIHLESCWQMAIGSNRGSVWPYRGCGVDSKLRNAAHLDQRSATGLSKD